MLVMSTSLGAQSLQVEKRVGQPLELNWDFPVASEPEIDGFFVQNCTGVDVGCTDVAGPMIAKTLRLWTTVVTAAFTAKPFFRVVSAKGTARSDPSNPVAVTITIPPPLVMSGR